MQSTFAKAPLIARMLQRAEQNAASRVAKEVHDLIEDQKRQVEFLATELEMARAAGTPQIPAAGGPGATEGDSTPADFSRPPPWFRQLLTEEIERYMQARTPASQPVAAPAPAPYYPVRPQAPAYNPAAGGGQFPFRSFTK